MTLAGYFYYICSFGPDGKINEAGVRTVTVEIICIRYL
jgi:hypothetical protein